MNLIRVSALALVAITAVTTCGAETPSDYTPDPLLNQVHSALSLYHLRCREAGSQASRETIQALNKQCEDELMRIAQVGVMAPEGSLSSLDAAGVALAFEHLRQYERGLPWANFAISADSTNQSAHSSKVRILLNLKRLEEADAALVVAKEVLPAGAAMDSFHSLLSRRFRRAGDPERARWHLIQYIEWRMDSLEESLHHASVLQEEYGDFIALHKLAGLNHELASYSRKFAERVDEQIQRMRESDDYQRDFAVTQLYGLKCKLLEPIGGASFEESIAEWCMDATNPLRFVNDATFKTGVVEAFRFASWNSHRLADRERFRIASTQAIDVLAASPDQGGREMAIWTATHLMDVLKAEEAGERLVGTAAPIDDVIWGELSPSTKIPSQPRLVFYVPVTRESNFGVFQLLINFETAMEHREHRSDFIAICNPALQPDDFSTGIHSFPLLRSRSFAGDVGSSLLSPQLAYRRGMLDQESAHAVKILGGVIIPRVLVVDCEGVVRGVFTGVNPEKAAAASRLLDSISATASKQ